MKKLSKRGYLTETGEKYYTNKTMKLLEKSGYIKNGRLNVRFGSKNLKAGDLVITFEIFKVVKKFYNNNNKKDNSYSCVNVLPVCSVKECNQKGCGHEFIKSTEIGQQGITKLLKWKK